MDRGCRPWNDDGPAGLTSLRPGRAGIRQQRIPVGQLIGEVVFIPIVFAIEAGAVRGVHVDHGRRQPVKLVFAVVVFASLIGSAGTLFSIPIA
jgi:hypothetical protein